MTTMSPAATRLAWRMPVRRKRTTESRASAMATVSAVITSPMPAAYTTSTETPETKFVREKALTMLAMKMPMVHDSEAMA